MNRNSLLFAALVAVLALFWFTFGKVKHAPDESAGTSFLGTWKDEKGPPGSYLSLQLVPRPSTLPGIEFLEGQGHVRGLFGEANSAIIWNYENHDQLRLNVIIGKKSMVAPVRMLGPDRMLMRWVPTADVNEWSSDKALEGPGAVILTRAKVEPEAP